MRDNDLKYAKAVIDRNTPKKFDFSTEESKENSVVIYAFRRAYFSMVMDKEEIDICGIMWLLRISDNPDHQNAYSEGIHNILFRRIGNFFGPNCRYSNPEENNGETYYKGIDFNILRRVASFAFYEIISLNESYKLPDFKQKLFERFRCYSLVECIFEFCDKYINQQNAIYNEMVDYLKSCRKAYE